MTKPSPKLILASASPYKKNLLSRLNLPFRACDAAIAEIRHPNEPPSQFAQRLAHEKAQALATSHPDHFIIGSDQVIALGQRIFQKPRTPQKAVEQLLALQAKTHHLFNAICLITPNGQIFDALSTFEMTMRPLTRAALQAYVALDQPLDCAGSYRIESAGIRLFESTRGDDPTAIEGLPLISVWNLFIQAGVVDE